MIQREISLTTIRDPITNPAPRTYPGSDGGRVDPLQLEQSLRNPIRGPERGIVVPRACLHRPREVVDVQAVRLEDIEAHTALDHPEHEQRHIYNMVVAP